MDPPTKVWMEQAMKSPKWQCIHMVGSRYIVGSKLPEDGQDRNSHPQYCSCDMTKNTTMKTKEFGMEEGKEDGKVKYRQ